MKNLLLGIIAINLTFISANLALRSVEPVQAHTAVDAEMDEIKDGLKEVLNTCKVKSNSRINCRY